MYSVLLHENHVVAEMSKPSLIFGDFFPWFPLIKSMPNHSELTIFYLFNQISGMRHSSFNVCITTG